MTCSKRSFSLIQVKDAASDRVKTQAEVSAVPEFTTLVGRDYNGSVEKYTRSVSRRIGVIKQDWTNDVLLSQGFALGEEYARSEYHVDLLYESLMNYDGPSTWTMRDPKDWAVWRRAVSKVESKFKDYYGSIKSLPLDENLWDAIKTETSSGLPDLLPKRLVFASELLKAQRILAQEKARSMGDKVSNPLNPEPCVAYFRTQTSINGGKPKKKVRLVWGMPLSQILIEATYARPAIDLILSAVTPITIGFRKSELGAMMGSTEWWPVAGTFDWSKWDAFCPTQLIMEAFRIVRRMFTDVDDSVWNQITRYFCTCSILMPNGKVYSRRRRGIPSGSFFTSLIGSIANLLAIHFLAYQQNVDVIDAMVLGDDSCVGFVSQINVGRMVKDAKYYLGMKLNLDKLVYGGSRANPHYLGHDWIKGRICRPIVETVQRIQYPERYDSDWWVNRYHKLVSLYGDNVWAWPLIVKILKEKGLATLLGSGEQFLLKTFVDIGGFTMTESPEKRAERKRFALATLK
jgi:hypothetical protein